MSSTTKFHWADAAAPMNCDSRPSGLYTPGVENNSQDQEKWQKNKWRYSGGKTVVGGGAAVVCVLRRILIKNEVVSSGGAA